MIIIKDLELLLKNIIGKEIWDFRLGESTGSIISFECGNKLESESNGRSLEGEHSFMIYCSWKISNRSKLIASWKEDSVFLKKEIVKIENLKILGFHISESYDLVLKLENDSCLNVFCDLGTTSEFDCNWFFRTGLKYYSINNNGGIDME